MLTSRVISESPFTILWAGNIGDWYCYILGHEDKKISWCRTQEYDGIERVCGKSIWGKIEADAPLHVQNIVVPSPFGKGLKPIRLFITDHRLTINDHIYTIRLACDTYNGVWVQFGEPTIQDVV